MQQEVDSYRSDTVQWLGHHSDQENIDHSDLPWYCLYSSGTKKKYIK